MGILPLLKSCKKRDLSVSDDLMIENGQGDAVDGDKKVVVDRRDGLKWKAAKEPVNDGHIDQVQ